MDTGQTPKQPILETLRTVEFRLGLKGYNVDEVDEYLEKAAVEAERLSEELRQTTERLRQLESDGAPAETPPETAAPEPAPTPVADDALQQTLILAQRFVEQAKRESEAEATSLVSSAEERAKSLVARAEEEARQLMADSQKQLREEVKRLETLRAQLVVDVDNMANHLVSERTRLRTMLSEVLKWIDENVQPGESLMAARPQTVDEDGRGGPAEPVDVERGQSADDEDAGQGSDKRDQEPTTVAPEPRS
jgi:DivIVA domain-containing protein